MHTQLMYNLYVQTVQPVRNTIDVVSVKWTEGTSRDLSVVENSDTQNKMYNAASVKLQQNIISAYTNLATVIIVGPTQLKSSKSSCNAGK